MAGVTWLLFQLRGALAIILTAVVIASSIDPVARWFQKLKIPRAIAVIFIYLATVSALGFIFYLIVPPLLSDAVGFLSDLPRALQNAGAENNLRIPTGVIDSLRNAVSELDASSLTGLGGVFGAATGIFGGAVSFLLIIVLSFYLSVEERGIENFLRIVSPKDYEAYVLELWTRCRRKIGFWLQGQLILAVLIGVVVYLGFIGLRIWGFDIKYALLLALLAGVLEIIPVFGPIIAAIPAVAIGFVVSPVVGLLVLAMYVIVQQLENHVIYPIVVRKVIGIPPLLVILSIFLGATLAGFFGILLAVPVATVLMEFINDFAKRRQIEF